MPGKAKPASPRALVDARSPLALKGGHPWRLRVVGGPVHCQGGNARTKLFGASAMLHVPPLVSTLAIGLVLAFSLGVLAHRLKLPPLIGYLLAGIAIGPFTPGFVADQSVANQLAEIGVILLMFGVGLHFSLEDLLSVRAIAVSGALAQALVATPLGMAVGWWQGWTPGAVLVFGIALSIAST